VLEKLAPIDSHVLQSTELIRGLVGNSSDILKQVHETKALVLGNGIAIKVRLVHKTTIIFFNHPPLTHRKSEVVCGAGEQSSQIPAGLLLSFDEGIPTTQETLQT
jgi:hypothetical protein